jgi:tetrahydromethanopterin S-methyltransferase subunit B
MIIIPTPTSSTATALKKISGRPVAACISSYQVRQSCRNLTSGIISKATQTSTSPGREAVAQRRFCTNKDPPVHKATFSTAAHVAMNEPTIQELFEPVTGTWQYVVADPKTHHAVIIDPVLNYDASKGVITTESADMILYMVAERSYKIKMILETHAHADHLTAASYIQATLAKNPGHRPLIGIGGRIKQVQQLFGQRYGVGANEYENVFDKLFEDDEEFEIGTLAARAIHLPGHTPDHMGYKIGSECTDSRAAMEIVLTWTR